MGDYTLNNLGSTSNANNVTDNDQGLVDDMLGNLTGGGGGTDNVTEYKSPFVVTAYWTAAKSAELLALTDAATNLWTWKVPYDYSVVEFSVNVNQGSVLLDGVHYYTLTLETASSRSGSWTVASTATINASTLEVLDTTSLPTNVDVSSTPYIRVKLVKTGSANADLQVSLKFKMAHVG